MHAVQFLIFTVSQTDYIALGAATQLIGYRKQSCDKKPPRHEVNYYELPLSFF